MNRNNLYDLEILLHAILNCGLETTTSLKQNNTEFDGDIISEIERLYEIVKDDNEAYEEE